MIEYLLFLFLIAFILAKLEINIEGKHGWAKNLPTWQIKNKVTSFIYGDLPLTGYHFWLMMFILVFLHFPFFIFKEWSLSIELRALSLFFFIWLVEDFLWFVLNPDYGFKKFNKENITWHHQWFTKIPISYFKFAFAGIALLLCSYYI